MKVKLRLTLILVSAFILLSYSTYSQTVTKQIYLTDPSQALDRVDPVSTADATTASTAILGQGVPELGMATYLGGTDADYVTDIALDASGNIYVVGNTQSTDFPTTSGVYDQTHNGFDDVFVTKLNPTGTSVIWSTYIGGSDNDDAKGIAVDGSGNVYISGQTASTDFPMVNAYDNTYAGSSDFFIAKLSASGGSLLYSTYLGGTGYEDGYAADMVLVGSTVYVSGVTGSAGFPMMNAFDSSLGGTRDLFITAINTAISGSGGLQFSTYVGGTGLDFAGGFDVDGAGNMYITGFRSSGTWTTPTAGAFDATVNGENDGFLLKLSPTGTKLYATWLGGNDYDAPNGLSVGDDGYVYITGITQSTNFPVTSGAYDETATALGNSDAFVVKMDLAGNGANDLLYGTYLGGADGDYGRSIAAHSGIIYVSGYSLSTDFPLVDEIQTLGGSADLFLSRIYPAGNGSSDLIASTFLGGSEYEVANSLVLNAAGEAYLVGQTASSNFPATAGAYDQTFGGGDPNYDGVISKISFNGGGAGVTTTFTQSPAMCSNLDIAVSSTITVSLYVNEIVGTITGSSDITGELKYGATTIANLTNAGISAGVLTLSGTTLVGTVPAGQSIVLDITNNELTTTFTIDYDSQTKPSKIELPTSTYIDITSFAVYDAPYPGGNIITDGIINGTVYVRATVSDPFGYDDITGLDLNITPTVGIVSASSVATSGCTRTYEYVWNTPATIGTYNIEATAKEGFENTVTDVENISFDISPIEVNDCDGNSFNSPGAPATCTYTYDSGSWDVVPPSNIGSSDSVCILANNSTDFGNFQGDIYIAPGVTYSGDIGSLSSSSNVIVAGTASIAGSPSLSGTIYIEPTGVYNVTDTNFSPSGDIHNAGILNAANDVSFNGSVTFTNYPNGTVNVPGDMQIIKPFNNCGLLEVIGDVNAGGSGTLNNLCTLYVHGDLHLNNDLTNDALLVIDGDIKFNGKDMTNNGTMLVDNITLDRDRLIGNDISSILIVRNDARLVNGGGITGHYYFDLDNGGGFDYVCGSCTEEIILLESVTLPAIPGDITTDCGVNIVVEYPFCKTVENDNTMYGYVFNDFNRNGAYDSGEPAQSGVTVNLYSDLNFNGIIDGADSIIQTTLTNLNGEYTLGVTPIVNTNQVFSKRVDRSSDDAEQDDKSGVVISRKQYNFELINPFVGIRINDISIPRGSRINSATMSFYSKDDLTGFLSYEISGQEIDNAPTFTEIDNNISNRWDETNKVPWFNMVDWLADTVYTTPDISSIVQQNINRIGWMSNNSMAFIFKYFLGTDTNREVVAYDDVTATAPLLEINYDAAEPASYIVKIDASTLPGGYNLTTSNSYVVPFTWVNEISCDNDFGFASPCNDLSGTDTDGDGVNDGCDLDDDNDGILDVDECSDLGKPQILNSDFEYVNIVSSGLDQGGTDFSGAFIGVWKGDSSHVPNWESVHAGNILEIWQNGHNLADDLGGTAHSGTQWSEVNISTNDGLYQDITTTPGDLLQWSFAHRKRVTYAGGADDVMELFIGDATGALVSQGTFTSANDATWTVHSGTYTVPVGQITTRLRFTAISTASGSIVAGNFIDSVQLYAIPNCENTDGDAYVDYLDIDSDDDGIPDNIEAQATKGYLPPTGVVYTNGLYPNYTSGLTLTDTDSDGIYDFRDLDVDADGVPDIEENGMANIAGPSDTDADGLNDVFETTGVNDVTWDVNEDIDDPTDLTILPDTDGDIFLDGDLDYRDLFDTNLPEFARIDFDGDNDFIEITDSPINYIDEFTISFWMKLEETLTGGIIDKTFVIGQKDMFEISIGNNTDGNPHVWATHFYGAGPSPLTSPGHPINDVNWLHITARVSYITEIIDVYVNGELVNTLDISGNLRLTNINPFRVGSKLNIQPDPDQENFNGWVDEIRIFSSFLTTSQIQRMVYQEIENHAGVTHGVTIGKDIIDPVSKASIPWFNLICYLPMNQVKNSKVQDRSHYANHGKLFNMFTIEPQDVPMPYVTKSGGDGAWTTEGTWLSGDVWDIEDIDNNKDWSIVQIKTNVTTTRSHTHLGMLIDAGGTLTVGDTALDDQDFEINNTWYLQLDGTIDLQDDSQLIQGINSDLVTSATGKILRRQEGNANYLWYNYWSSPVGVLKKTNLSDNNGTSNNNKNTPFSISMLKDQNGNPIEFTTAFNESGKISTRWLHTFKEGVTYYDWVNVDENTNINPGIGYTQKGTGIDSNPDPLITEQQYIFEGKPNNGTIKFYATDTGGPGSVEGSSFTSYLIGNPYPSALDADQFIKDNIDFENGSLNPTIQGTILLWEQWAGSSHFLSAYEGGYGFINLTESARAYQHPDIIISDPTNPDNRGIKTPTKFIPVGQAFFVEVVNDGDIVFNNGQRVFKQEDLGESIFFRTSNTDNTQSGTEETATETQILRLEFGVSSGASRSFVLGFTEDATDGYDYGLDGGLINDPPADDIGSLLNGQQYVIQAFAPYTIDKEIDLVLHASGNFAYTLKATEISNFPEDQDIFLKDNLTGNFYDLRSTQEYSFTSDAGTFTDRFQVVFQDPAALSIEDFTTDNTFIYVNQAEDKLYVKQLNDQAKEMKVTNMLGQTIRTFSSINNQTLENGIDISKLSSGVYVVSIKTANEQSIDKKVIIQ